MVTLQFPFKNETVGRNIVESLSTPNYTIARGQQSQSALASNLRTEFAT